MYAVVRKIHLYAGLIISCFLFMYFVTGGVLILEHFFPRKNHPPRIEKLAVDPSATEEEQVAHIVKTYDIRGRGKRSQGTQEVTWQFTRPGHQTKVILRPPLPVAEISVTKGTFASVMNYFHRLRGYEGDLWHVAWALLYDLSCIALILFAFSGIYLWWKIFPEKWPGVAFFTISAALTVFTVLYMIAVC